MDAGAKKLLDSVTIETLHAHNFSRSSTQATIVLTDLLSRYLALLSTTCAKYAQHAGRLRLTARDAISALDELGLGVDELSEYCVSESRDLARYASHTARRAEDLKEFKAALAIGVREERDEIPLVYAPVPSPISSDVEDEDEEIDEGFDEDEDMDKYHSKAHDEELMQDTTLDDIPDGHPSRRPPASPTLPPSPISNPSSPLRKRPRTANWHPPPHIPDFLPPFPNASPRDSISPPPQDMLTPAASFVKLERPPTPPPQPQINMSSSSADYLSVIPYSQSTLSSANPRHLPTRPVSPPVHTPARLPVPQIQPALIGAYHHVLTHPPPPNPGPVNPARYRVALSLVAQTESDPRWEPAATLFSSTAPNPPRVAPIGPSYPVPISKVSQASSDVKSEKELNAEKDKKPTLPSIPPRPVAPCERLSPLISQQSSRIPKLARQVLSGSVYTRTTRLTHPPVLQRGTQKLTYGPGVNAPWNSSASPVPSAGLPPKKEGGQANGVPNGKDTEVEKKVLPDARLYATWNYEQKHYQEPLVAARRGRMGSIQAGMSGTTVGIPPSRARSESRVSER